MEISKIYQEEQRLTKYYVIRHSKLLVMQSMNINADLHQWSKIFCYKKAEYTSTHTGTRKVSLRQSRIG